MELGLGQIGAGHAAQPADEIRGGGGADQGQPGGDFQNALELRPVALRHCLGALVQKWTSILASYLDALVHTLVM